MPKTPDFIVNMKQPPRSMKHGKHRRTSPPAHGNPADGAGARNDRADALAYYSQIVPGDLTPLPAADYARLVADTLKAMNDLQAKVYESYFDVPKSKQIPHAGIRAGEIIGRR